MSRTDSSSAAAILQQTTASALKVFQARACSVALLRDDHLVYVNASGEGADKIVGTHLPLSRGLAGFAMAGGETVASFDVDGDARFANDVAESTGYVPRAVIAAPVQTQRGSYGVLTVLDPAVTGPVGERLLELVTLLAHQAGLTVEAQAPAQSPATEATDPGSGDLRNEAVRIIRALPEDQVEVAAQMLRGLSR